MQKKNKIMLKAVAILLSLVLITTCIVSSTFAKFVIQKSTQTVMTLEAYGVELELEVAQALKNACTVEEKINGNSLTVNLTNLKFAPGDDFTDSIIFSFSGTATTRIRFNIDVDIDFDLEKFKVPAGVGNLEEDTYFFPLGLKRSSDYIYYTGEDKSVTGNIRSPWRPLTSDKIPAEDFLFSFLNYDFNVLHYDPNIYDYVSHTDLSSTGSYRDDGSKDTSIEKIYNKGDEIFLNRGSFYLDTGEKYYNKANNLKLGFYLPYDIDVSDTSIYDANLDYVQIENYLLNVLSNEEYPIDMSFTISIEQVSNSYTIPNMALDRT